MVTIWSQADVRLSRKDGILRKLLIIKANIGGYGWT